MENQIVKKKVLVPKIKKDSNRLRNVRSFKSLLKNLSILKKILPEELRMLDFLLVSKLNNKLIHSKIIAETFNWGKSKTNRTIKSAEEKGLIYTISECPYCGKLYKRIPETCFNPNCSKPLITDRKDSKTKTRAPHYLTDITPEGKDFFSKKVQEYFDAIDLYKKRSVSLLTKFNT